MLKRGYKGMHRRWRVKHLDRYLQEFAGRQDLLGLDTCDQRAAVVRGLEKKRSKYRELSEGT